MNAPYDLWRGVCTHCEFETDTCAVLEIAERLLLDHSRVAHPEIAHPGFEYVRVDDSASDRRRDTRDT